MATLVAMVGLAGCSIVAPRDRHAISIAPCTLRSQICCSIATSSVIAPNFVHRASHEKFDSRLPDVFSGSGSSLQPTAAVSGICEPPRDRPADHPHPGVYGGSGRSGGAGMPPLLAISRRSCDLGRWRLEKEFGVRASHRLPPRSSPPPANFQGCGTLQKAR